MGRDPFRIRKHLFISGKKIYSLPRLGAAEQHLPVSLNLWQKLPRSETRRKRASRCGRNRRPNRCLIGGTPLAPLRPASTERLTEIHRLSGMVEQLASAQLFA